MTVPAGFLAGLAVMTELLAIGVSGKVTVVLTLVVAALGPVWILATERSAQRKWRPRGELLWAAGAAVVAYAIALAPLAGGGRIGILGYIFNDDPSIHISLVQALHDGGAHALNQAGDSFQRTTYAFNAGYPLGSYTWPLVAVTATGIDPFDIWSPFTALAVALLALACFEILRPLRAPPVLTGIAAALIANGHLVYAYLTQGGLKEVLLPVCVYSTAALLQQALGEGIKVRALVPAAFAAAAAVADLGTAGL